MENYIAIKPPVAVLNENQFFQDVRDSKTLKTNLNSIYFSSLCVSISTKCRVLLKLIILFKFSPYLDKFEITHSTLTVNQIT